MLNGAASYELPAGYELPATRYKLVVEPGCGQSTCVASVAGAKWPVYREFAAPADLARRLENCRAEPKTGPVTKETSHETDRRSSSNAGIGRDDVHSERAGTGAGALHHRAAADRSVFERRPQRARSALAKVARLGSRHRPLAAGENLRPRARQSLRKQSARRCL